MNGKITDAEVGQMLNRMSVCDRTAVLPNCRK